MDKNTATTAALEALVKMLSGPSDGQRLEAAREILKYSAATE